MGPKLRDTYVYTSKILKCATVFIFSDEAVFMLENVAWQENTKQRRILYPFNY